MPLFAWLKSRFARRPAITDQEIQVTIDDTGVTCRRPSGMVESVSWNDLQKVSVRTTDSGPFAVDAYFVLYGSRSGCVIPQSTPQSGELLERLQALHDFDNNAVMLAMGSTDNHEFVCWERAPQ